jgi:iron complex transport system permease protein
VSTAARVAGRAAAVPRLSGPLVVAAGCALLALALAASVMLGATRISPADAVGALVAPNGSRAHVVVIEARVPRTLLAAAVGAALGVAGALMQAVSRNALAEPSLLGISWGAALAVVAAQYALAVGSAAAFVPAAVAGAAAAGLLVVSLGAVGRAGLTPERLVVAGAAVSALLAALVQAVLVVDRQSLEVARRWLAGSLAGAGVDALLAALPYLAAGAALAFALARPLTTLALGEDVARALGQRTGGVKAAAALAVVLLAGAAVAVAGPIVLVGLAVPHVARAAVGRDLVRVLPACALLGAVLVLAGDVAARLVIAPDELPVGVMTALLGAPIFLHVARRGASVG